MRVVGSPGPIRGSLVDMKQQIDTDAGERRVRAIFHPGDTDVVDRFEAALEGSRWSVERCATDDPAEVGRLASDAASADIDVIAAVGGDGSLNLVLDSAVTTGLPILTVPAGTVNLTSHLMGIDEPEDAAEALLRGRSLPIDVGVDVRSDDSGESSPDPSDEATSCAAPGAPFVINASSGFDAAVIRDAADHSDSRLGRLRFGVEAVRRLRRERPRHVMVRVDGERFFTGRAMSVIVMNAGQRAGASVEVAPDAQMDDGRLDVAIVRADSLGRGLRTVARILSRRPVPDTDLLRVQGESIEVDWGSARPTQRDGDAIDERASLTYRIDSRQLSMVALPDEA